MEQRVIVHAGTDLPSTAHTHLDVPARGAELAGGTVRTLVVEVLAATILDHAADSH